jgi:hypothetical protein
MYESLNVGLRCFLREACRSSSRGGLGRGRRTIRRSLVLILLTVTHSIADPFRRDAIPIPTPKLTIHTRCCFSRGCIGAFLTRLVRSVSTVLLAITPQGHRHALLLILTHTFVLGARPGLGTNLRILVASVLAVAFAVALPLIRYALSSGATEMSDRTGLKTVGWELVTSVNAVPLAVATPLHWNAPNLVARKLLGRTYRRLALILVRAVPAVSVAVATPTLVDAASIVAKEVSWGTVSLRI